MAGDVKAWVHGDPLVDPPATGEPGDVPDIVPGPVARLRDVAVRSAPAVGATLAVWTPMLVWFLTFRPGLMTADSIGAFEQVRSGSWTDGTNPPLFTLGLWLAVQFGGISLLTLGQSLFLAAAIVSVARASRRAGAPLRFVVPVVALLAISPAVGAFSVTLWKDIPYSAAFLMVTARTIDISTQVLHDRPITRWAWASLGLWSLALALLRSNGPAVVALMGLTLIVALRRHWQPAILVFAATGAAFVVAREVVYPLAGVAKLDGAYASAPFIRDIAGAYVHSPRIFEAADLDLMNELLPLDYWEKYYDCQTVNLLYFLDPSIDRSAVARRTDEIYSLWIEALREAPTSIIDSRWCAGSIALRPWSYKLDWVFTVNPGIDPNPYGVRTTSLLSPMKGPLTSLVNGMNDPVAQTFLWRAPGYVYLVYLLAAAALVRTRRAIVALPLIPLASQQIAIASLAVAQDARYMFMAHIGAVLLLPLMLWRILRPSSHSPAEDDPADVSLS